MMKKLFTLFSALVALPLVSLAASPSICNPSFGDPGRQLPRFCGGANTSRMVSPVKATPVVNNNTVSAPMTSGMYPYGYGNATAVSPSRIMSRYNQIEKRPASFYTSRTAAQMPTRSIRPAEQNEVEVAVDQIPFNESFAVANQPQQLLSVYVRNAYGNRSYFKSAARLKQMDLILEYVGGGIGSVDMTDFYVYNNGVPHRVSADGRVQIDLGNERLLEGESTDFALSVGFVPMPILPAYSGTFRLSVSNVVAMEENTREEYEVTYLTERQSRNFAFGDITDTLQSGNNVRVRTLNQQSTMLVGGASHSLMTIAITPEFASLEVDTLKIKNTTSLSPTDVFEDLKLINADTGEVYDTRSFSGSSLTFNPSNLVLPINQQTKLEIVAETRENPASGDLNLILDGSGLELYSVTSGNEVNPLSVDISGDNFAYSVTPGTLTINHANLPSNGFAVTELPEGVYRFTVSNPSGSDIFLARMSLRVLLYGLDWEGNLLDDEDVELWQIASNGQRYVSDFEPTIMTDGIRFDASPTAFIPSGQTYTYELRLRLKHVGTNTDDEISISWLESNTNNSGTLNSLQGSSAYTIWQVDQERNPWQSGNALVFPSTSFTQLRQ